jgi:beta-glucosidase
MNSGKKIQLPRYFLLGAALSAHQAEGNNTNSDWWYFEQEGRVPKTGNATDHYNRYAEDFTLAKQMGLNAIRISIEWARIEPQEGVFDQNEIAHYRKVLQSLQTLQLTPMVTLQHFTFPMWFAKQGGWLAPQSDMLFARYCAKVVSELQDVCNLWLTINEPEVHALLGYIRGVHPPFKRNPWKFFQVTKAQIRAHTTAYDAIKKVNPTLQVSLAKNNVHYEAMNPNNFLDKMVIKISKYIGEDFILNRVKDKLDFIGLNFYFSEVLAFSWKRGIRRVNIDAPRSDMGWRTYPKGLYFLLKDLSRFHKPVYITENGIANARDDMRADFIREHLYWTMRAIHEGVDVRGYFYWALTDTYEWHDGFDRKFGLVEINYETLERRVRPSVSIFKELA